MPLPLLPEVMFIQDALLDAFQLHPFATVTLTLPVPLEEPNEVLVEDMEYVQEISIPDCVTVNVLPAIVIVPVRELPVFDKTEQFTVPSPVPLLPEVIINHDGSLLDAVTRTPP